MCVRVRVYVYARVLVYVCVCVTVSIQTIIKDIFIPSFRKKYTNPLISLSSGK